MSQPTPDETLLGLLMAEPQHGYQLLETFQDERALGRVWKLSTSQLYAVLKRLQTQGFITGEEAYSEDAPPRTVYYITNTGKAYVMAWLAEEEPSPSVRRVRVEYLSRLYVARLLNLPIRNIVHHQKIACEEKYRQLIEQRQLPENTIGSLSLELEIAQLEAILGWITQLEHISI
jgi:DNA-binding PadR family transcriptional regulator